MYVVSIIVDREGLSGFDHLLSQSTIFSLLSVLRDL